MTRLDRDARTRLTYAQLGAFGYFIYGFGPAVALLRDEQGFSRTVAGLHGTALAVGGLIASLVVAELSARLGRTRMIWVGLTLMCLGVTLLCGVTALPATLGGALVASLGGSFVVTCTATALAAAHGTGGPAAITEANAVAAAFGALAPLAVGVAAALGSWRVALLLLLPAVGLLALVSQGTPQPADVEQRAAATAPGRLGRAFWVAWAVVTAGIAVEFCLALWAADLLRLRTGMSAAAASASVTAFVLGMALGRGAAGRLVLRHTPERLLSAALALNAAGFLVFWSATTPVLAVAGLLACGLGVAAYFPLGLARAIAASGGRPDRASARVGLGAALASGSGPIVLGALADSGGIHRAMLVVPALIAVAAVGIRLGPTPTSLPSPAAPTVPHL